MDSEIKELDLYSYSACPNKREGLRVNQDYQTQKNITHKKAAHIEAHFLRLLKKI